MSDVNLMSGRILLQILLSVYGNSNKSVIIIQNKETNIGCCESEDTLTHDEKSPNRACFVLLN